jgi:acetyl esterase/lipase
MRRRTLLALGLASAGAIASLAACSPLRILNTLTPADGVAITRDEAYGPDPANRLDVYAPRQGRGPFPVVVFFYGGSWQNGQREDYFFAGASLASRGFVAVLPDYRKYPQVVFPGFLEDGALAVAWAKRNAARFGGDPSRVFLMGHSAGAHIAAMLSLDSRYLGAQGLDPKDLAGLVGLAGPYDFLPLRDPVLKTIFAPESTIARTQPITFVTPGAPRAFLATGADDTTVNPRNTANLAAKLRAAGASVREKRYEGLNHYTLIGALGEPLRSRNPVFEDVIAFLQEASAAP